MKKTIILLTCMVAACAISDELRLSSPTGKHNQKTMVPYGWYLNGHASYKPAPTIDYPDGTKVIHVSNVKGKEGFAFCHANRFPARDGDKVIVTARVKGTGTGWFGLQVYHESKWLAMLPVKKYPLTPEWKVIRIELPVSDVSALHSTTRFMFTFGAGHDSELFLSDLKVELSDKSGIAGNIPLPVKWDVFLPMKKDFLPSEAELRSIPAQLDGVKPRQMLLTGNEFDFETAFGGNKEGRCVWMFTRITAPQDGPYTIGAGADWWMTIWVNGKIAIDTRKTGNIKHPARMADFLAAAELKKGDNVIAVRFVTGRASSKIALAGPLELKARGQKMRIVKTLCKDDFEQTGKRTGNPEIIQDVPTRGLLDITGQAVYKTTSPLSIRLPKNTGKVPELSGGNYFATGLRIQNFGRSLRNDSSLTIRMNSKKDILDVVFNHNKNAEDITGVILLNGKKNKDFRFPYNILPADIMFNVNASGDYLLSVSSLSDSSYRVFAGSIPSRLWNEFFKTEMIFSSANTSAAELVIDNYVIAQTMPEDMRIPIPFKLELQPTFDPVKAGWKKVFFDEFDGEEVDWTKWTCSDKYNVKLDGKGFLEVRTGYQPSSGQKRLKGASMHTLQRFKYGYFEARVRFTSKPGWWSFCYLYAGDVGNPLLGGMEIDVYEDYYMAGKKGNKDGCNILDHNLHCYIGGILKSWNYNTFLPGKADDFYVIGCKWTPSEISYYLNGKLMKSSANHSPHSSVTFDPVNHANGIVPLDYRIGAHTTNRGIEGAEPIDEVFKADYVRIYAYPEDLAPTAEWVNNNNPPLVVHPGEKFELEAKAAPSTKTGVALTGAYLLDSGQVIGYKSTPPYKFTVAISPEFYDGNAYSRGGRAGNKAHLGALHAYAILVQDAAGKTAYTPPILKFPIPMKKSTPYKGKAQVIPGTINTSFYDEGGNGVGYLDDDRNNFSKSGFRINEGVDTSGDTIGYVVTGEWIRLTVDIKEAGTYSAKLHYGTPEIGNHQMLMLLDDRELGRFMLPPHKVNHWGVVSQSSLHNLELPAGRHVITLVAIGRFNYGKLDFVKTKK